MCLHALFAVEALQLPHDVLRAVGAAVVCERSVCRIAGQRSAVALPATCGKMGGRDRGIPGNQAVVEIGTSPGAYRR